MLETDARSAGFFTTDTRRVLAATVESLRAEQKLLVFTFKGSAAVSAERSVLGIVGGQQDLIVPAAVGYYVDLSDLTLNRVTYDERTRVVTATLPRLVLGDVAFQPEAARAINGGVLTFSQSEVEDLSRQNYVSARRAIIKQAQGPALLNAARREARRTIERTLELPLRMAGRPDLRVVATFAPPPPAASRTRTDILQR